MLTNEQNRAAADHLWQHWRDDRRLPALPISMRPMDRVEGYAIQARLESKTNSPLFGWKIAATSAAGQTHIGVTGPLAGRLLAERAFDSGSELRLGHNVMRVVEPEFAFRMERDLPPRPQSYQLEEVMNAVGALHPALEVPDSRFTDFASVGEPQLIADNACADEFVLGPPAATDWRAVDLAHFEVRASVGGAPIRVGSGANVLGDPRVALTWLANELSSLRVVLRAGQIVTTGTCMAPLAVDPGSVVLADFGPLGAVTLGFAND